jgi:hypothetical protein
LGQPISTALQTAVYLNVGYGQGFAHNKAFAPVVALQDVAEIYKVRTPIAVMERGWVNVLLDVRSPSANPQFVLP